MSGGDARERLLAATLACFERQGMAATSLEDVANQAGLSRATVYRTFPGGRDQLVSDTVSWEIGTFLARLGEAVADDEGVHAVLTHALMVGHRAISEHRLLHQLLSTEPEALYRELLGTEPLLHELVRDYIAELLAHEEVRAGVDRLEAADHLARLFLSYLGTPGSWDLDDPVAVDHLVRTQFLAGVLAA